MDHTASAPGNAVETLDSEALLTNFAGAGIPWSCSTGDLNANLIVWKAGESSPLHVNQRRDVCYICLAGEGILDVEGQHINMRPGVVAVVPKGRARELRAFSDRFAYLTCHRRNPGLWPEGSEPPDV